MNDPSTDKALIENIINADPTLKVSLEHHQETFEIINQFIKTYKLKISKSELLSFLESSFRLIFDDTKLYDKKNIKKYYSKYEKFLSWIFNLARPSHLNNIDALIFDSDIHDIKYQISIHFLYWFEDKVRDNIKISGSNCIFSGRLSGVSYARISGGT